MAASDDDGGRRLVALQEGLQREWQFRIHQYLLIYHGVAARVGFCSAPKRRLPVRVDCRDTRAFCSRRGRPVRCSKCGFENPAAAKFCSECAAPMAAKCPRCGASNQPGAKFCNECAAALAPASTVSQPAPAVRVTAEQPDSSAALEGERKTVTALFADIKGSMDLIEDIDPEEARAIVDPALKLMMDAVHRFDGYIVQSTGDGVFALFGAPVAHEDHPQRSLYAALRMQDEVKRYAEKLRAEKGVNLQVRVGVNTGEVVVRSIKTGEGHVEYTP
ncbi:MAG TPA: adenylate/guanylate cyclase domain-containing protein, partial [Candidatus Acidoferrales bacterium]|nr:adenylate/guanylate cyclase domain-containing protein [Candidatus Acidoferrales bacterium]